MTVWEKSLTILEERLTAEEIKRWFRPLRPREDEPSVLTLSAPNRFFADWIRDKYSLILAEAVQVAAGRELSFRIVTPQGGPAVLGPEIGPLAPPRSGVPSTGARTAPGGERVRGP